MKLFIPELGTRLRLLKPATFTIKPEKRNQKLFHFAGKDYVGDRYIARPEKGSDYVFSSIRARDGAVQHWHLMKGTRETFKYTVPTAEVLIVDRIYIRQGNSKFSSVTFKWAPPELQGKQVRFFVPLEEANQLEVLVEKEQDHIGEKPR